MKKFLTMLVCLFMTLTLRPANCLVKPSKIYNFIEEVTVPKRQVVDDYIIEALIHVESNGDDNAKGDITKGGHYKAIGALQIHTVYVDEVNKILEKEGQDHVFTYADRYDRKKSIMMAKIYLTYFCEKYGRWDYAFIARCHNGGGYGGWKNPRTVKYVRLVDNFLVGNSDKRALLINEQQNVT